jgi:hypothetical protein
MAVRNFPWLADIERSVRTKLDLPIGQPGRSAFDFNAEFVQACNDQYLYIWERISSTDRNFGIAIDDTVTASAGVEFTDLPATVRALRKVQRLDSQGKVQGPVDVVTFDQQYTNQPGCEGAGLYLPDSNQIRWLEPFKAAQKLRLVFSEHPVTLFHGCCSGVGGATTIPLATHESVEDSLYVAGQIYLYEGPGASDLRTGSGYVGRTRILTVSVAFTTTPTIRTRYTSRPKLRYDTKDAFSYGVAARMLEKMQDERWVEYSERRETHLRHLTTAVMLTEREEPLHTRDASVTGGHGDPWHSRRY